MQVIINKLAEYNIPHNKWQDNFEQESLQFLVVLTTKLVKQRDSGQ